MSLIRPFAGLRPAPNKAVDVAAPPYDVLSTEEARERAGDNRWSFLHISKPEIDFAPGTDPYSEAVYKKAGENLRYMKEQGILIRDPRPMLYAYRLVAGGVHQTGLVVAASVAAYDSNRIRKHEFTRPDKEDDRVRQIEALNAQTGPVLLAYRDDRNVEAILEDVASAVPESDVTMDDGVGHRLWAIRDTDKIDSLLRLFDEMPALYIADGHHRSAAASRVASRRQAGNNVLSGEAPHNYFLAVAFASSQMRILPYNRVVRDLNGLTAGQLLERITERFSVERRQGPVEPGAPGTFGFYVEGNWYHLALRPELASARDPIKRLDVSILDENLLAPILGIQDSRRDKRIEFVGGVRGLGALEHRVDSGDMACAVSMYPTAMNDLMAVADEDEVMPPKSTWFEPKLVDGLVSHELD